MDINQRMDLKSSSSFFFFLLPVAERIEVNLPIQGSILYRVVTLSMLYTYDDSKAPKVFF